MTSNIEQSAFFRKRKQEGALVVKDVPKFDLESYISNYDGYTRLLRLHHIGSSSPYLAIDAYHMAIAEAKQGKNVKLYHELVEEFSEIAPADPLAVPDLGWADKTERAVKEEKSKLDNELRSYKNNLIQESIRMGNEDLAHFHYACGDFAEAYRAYLRMRDHCTSGKQLLNMYLQCAHASVAQRTWVALQTQMAKVDSSQALDQGERKERLAPIVSACHGLAYMQSGNYLQAAGCFLRTSPTFLTMRSAAGITWQREVLSGNDVAVYGALCALASMDRSELREKVLDNSDFRNFLELEPHLRRAITLFCNSKYSACLEVLEGYRADYLLDVYLAKLVPEIYRQIRTKCIVQYFVPFSCVTLKEMTSRFQLTGEYASIEDELVDLINSGTLKARIDQVDGLLISPVTDARYTVHSEALAMAKQYDHTLQLRLTRINMLNSGLVIRQESGRASENKS